MCVCILINANVNLVGFAFFFNFFFLNVFIRLYCSICLQGQFFLASFMSLKAELTHILRISLVFDNFFACFHKKLHLKQKMLCKKLL